MHGEVSRREDRGRSRSETWKSARRRSLIVGLLTTAVLGIGAQASFAQVTVELGIDNNEYPALKDPSMISTLVNDYGIDTPIAGGAGQPGGYWNERGAGGDNTTLRGITSGKLRKQLLGGGPYTAVSHGCITAGGNPFCEDGPLQIDGFWSADEGNVNQVIPTGGVVTNATCTTGGSVVVCPGIDSTKNPTAVGQLAIYSCSATYVTDGADPGIPNNPVGAVSGSGNGVPDSPRCEATPISGGAPTNIAGVISWLAASTAHKLAIAGPDTDPSGAASKQALVQNGGGGTGFTYDDSSGTSTQNAWPSGANTNECEGALPSGAVCQVRLEAGISQVRGAVTSGTTPLGLAARSTLKHITWGSGTPVGTTGDDPNPWITLSPTAYSVYGPIQQWGVGISRTTPDTDKEDAVAGILNAFGPVGADHNIKAVMTRYGF
jgi:hypothetical protein